MKVVHSKSGKCSMCAGKGKTWVERAVDNDWPSDWEKCGFCNGHGNSDLRLVRKPCGSCNGSGKVSSGIPSVEVKRFLFWKTKVERVGTKRCTTCHGQGTIDEKQFRFGRNSWKVDDSNTKYDFK